MPAWGAALGYRQWPCSSSWLGRVLWRRHPAPSDTREAGTSQHQDVGQVEYNDLWTQIASKGICTSWACRSDWRILYDNLWRLCCKSPYENPQFRRTCGGHIVCQVSCGAEVKRYLVTWERERKGISWQWHHSWRFFLDNNLNWSFSHVSICMKSKENMFCCLFWTILIIKVLKSA